MATPEQARESLPVHLEKVLYTAKAHTTGGRQGGTSRTDDGRLDLHFTEPGQGGNGTNPEQLFACGWSTCFLSSILLVAGKRKIVLPEGLAVDAEVDLGLTHGVHGLAGRLKVSLPGMDRQAAQALADAAHQICPYSRMADGHIEIATTVVV